MIAANFVFFQWCNV